MLLLAPLAAAGCGKAEPNRIEPVYDENTGRLQLLRYDSDKDGRVDMTSEMDGSRIVRIAIDKDGDGRPERWEYYDKAQKVERVGLSRQNDGVEDAWSFPGPDGEVARIDIATRRDGKVTRTEHYQNNVLVGADEDSDGDGRRDKWERYADGRLLSVAFDTTHRGTADRRLSYDVDGGAVLELDPDGDGQFVAAASK